MKLGEAWVYINGDDKPLQGVFRRTRQEAQTWAGGVARSVKGILTGALSTAGGFLLAQVGIRALGDVARGVRGAIFDMNAVLETTQLQFATLMGSADAAREHVRMLFDFAKETPFETQPIITASLRLEEFGHEALNTRENLYLIGDAAAAVNAPIEELGMWVGRLYSALQIGAPVGQATRRLMELAVLTPRARVEIERLQEAGADAGEIFAVLQADLGRFTGAMAAQANTWKGITSTIKDSVQLLSATAMRPFFDLARRIGRTVADMLDLPEVEAGAERIAEVLQRLIERLLDLVRRWVTAFASIERETLVRIGRIVGFLDGLGRYMAGWGMNIVGALAQGIRAAVGSVIQALLFLGQVIAALLRPGSPPRLLPELDQWGKAAAEVWLGGWTEADFSALTRFGDTVADMLQGLALAGRMDEIDVVPRTMGLRTTFAEILHQVRETGEASEELYTAIREGAGDAGPELEQLARHYARVADAQGRLSDVERRLRALRGEQQQRQDAARLSELAAIMADPRATAGQRERAARETEIIGLLTEQRDLQEGVDEAQAGLSAFQSRLDVERETIGLLGQQRTLLQSLADALQGMLDPLMQALRGWQLQQAELRDVVRLAEIDYKLANDSLTVAQRTALELERQAIQADRLVRAREAAEIGVDLTGLAGIPIVPEDFLKGVGGAKDALGELEGGVGDVIGSLEELTGFDLSGLGASLQEMVDAFKEGFGEGQENFDEFLEQVPQIEGTLSALTEGLGGLSETLSGLEGPLMGVAAGVQEVAEALEFLSGVLGRGQEEGLIAWLLRLGREADTLNRERLAGLRGATDRLTDALRRLDAIFGVILRALGLVSDDTSALTERQESLSASLGRVAGWLVKAAQFAFNLMNPLSLLIRTVENVATAVDLAAQAFEKLVEWIGKAFDKLQEWKQNFGSSVEGAVSGVEGFFGKLGIPGFATGTPSAPGGLALVGELGPELVRLPRGSAVFPTGASQRFLAGTRGGDLIVNVGPVTLASDLDVEEMAYRVAAVVQRRGR